LILDLNFMASYTTKYFSFDNGILHVYKKGKIEQTPYAQITAIEIKKGSDLKRPKLALVFGALLVILCVKILGTYAFDLGEFFASGIILRIFAVLFFVGGVGVYAIHSALPIHPVIEVETRDTSEHISIKSIVKSGGLNEFSKFLQTEFKGKFRMCLKPTSQTIDH
jgi:hypothetical protein